MKPDFFQRAKRERPAPIVKNFFITPVDFCASLSIVRS
jgi:hypothetical protein